MLNTNQGRRQPFATLTLLLVLVALSCKGWAAFDRPADADAAEFFCTASEAYLAAVSGYQKSVRGQSDSSCLTDYVAIAKKIDSYQLIDIRENAAQPPVDDAWLMSVRELRTKGFLRDRPLLLIGQGFSRAEAVTDCAALKNTGFKQVKILLGGAEAWVSARHEKHFINTAITKRVSAEDLAFEYFNGQVALVATSVPVAEKVRSLGMEVAQAAPDHFNETVQNRAITNRAGSFLPVVVISEDDVSLDNSLSRLPNVFLLDGGVTALTKHFEDIQWTNLNRKGVPRRYMCGNA